MREKLIKTITTKDWIYVIRNNHYKFGDKLKIMKLLLDGGELYNTEAKMDYHKEICKCKCEWETTPLVEACRQKEDSKKMAFFLLDQKINMT